MNDIYMCGHCGNKIAESIEKLKKTIGKKHKCPVCNTINGKFVKVGKHNRHKLKG